MADDDPTFDWSPEERLLYDMETDHMAEIAQGMPPLSPEEILVRREEVRRLLESHGLVLPSESQVFSSDPPIIPFSRQLVIEPLASYAAADIVKSVTPWECGVIRLLQSPMRADLAVEVLVNEERRQDFSEGLFIVRVGELGVPVAVLPNESPVFCRVYAEDLASGSVLSFQWLSLSELGAEQLHILKKSRRNLRDPASLDRYETLIGLLETQ